MPYHPQCVTDQKRQRGTFSPLNGCFDILKHSRSFRPIEFAIKPGRQSLIHVSPLFCFLHPTTGAIAQQFPSRWKIPDLTVPIEQSIAAAAMSS